MTDPSELALLDRDGGEIASALRYVFSHRIPRGMETTASALRRAVELLDDLADGTRNFSDPDEFTLPELEDADAGRDVLEQFAEILASVEVAVASARRSVTRAAMDADAFASKARIMRLHGLIDTEGTR